ncbi:MAG: RtcB family protein [Phycisphaerales bacterium]
MGSELFARWGSEIDEGALEQMRSAMRLPVTAAGALMPDAHVGYGLPIGGVLATRGAVIPYAVGVDIACRMKLSVLDVPVAAFGHSHEMKRLTRAIEEETRWGIGCSFEGRTRREHPVMDEDWGVCGVTKRLKDKGWSQLGTSGSGNHFVEFGVLTVAEDSAGQASSLPGSGLPAPGQYVALLSHSGSRGTGAAVCDHYSKLAIEKRMGEIDPKMKHLSWLDLDSEEGREYWAAMELMGKYASANHGLIHRHIAKHLGAEVLASVENHHNFAWKERHSTSEGEEEVVVHRKGATPAGVGVLGVIPGSMATPGFVVRGKGHAASLNSASHGAGRVMSRTKAKEAFRWGNVRREIEALGITVLSAGIDEVPGVYKDIHRVMAEQSELVEVLARFDPKLVKMAPEGERAED